MVLDFDGILEPSQYRGEVGEGFREQVASASLDRATEKHWAYV